ncbi:hypothetical protein, partial [Corynebacterium sp. ES2775-CONJ]|uniref:hypothetical protein n=1 Tax=Corynebacterium sp. ES2775-CONJ TaxID=2974029 RepID=UPI002167DC48
SQPKPIMPTNSSYLRSKTKQATLTGHQKHHTIHQHNPTAIKKNKKTIGTLLSSQTTHVRSPRDIGTTD